MQLYYHGEPISVNVHVTNNSTKTVKRVKISGLPHPPLPHVYSVGPESSEKPIGVALILSLQCANTLTSACSAPPNINAQWPSWRQSESQLNHSQHMMMMNMTTSGFLSETCLKINWFTYQLETSLRLVELIWTSLVGVNQSELV